MPYLPPFQAKYLDIIKSILCSARGELITNYAERIVIFITMHIFSSLFDKKDS